MNSRYYKKYVEKLINDNPTEINIKREIEVDVGYGEHDVIVENVEEVVNFYDSKARREVLTDYGKTYTGISITKILAKGDANIVHGDTFIVNDIEYQVFHIGDYREICKQIELEVIG